MSKEKINYTTSQITYHVADIMRDNCGDDSVIEIVEALYDYFKCLQPDLHKTSFYNACGFENRCKS